MLLSVSKPLHQWFRLRANTKKQTIWRNAVVKTTINFLLFGDHMLVSPLMKTLHPEPWNIYFSITDHFITEPFNFLSYTYIDLKRCKHFHYIFADHLLLGCLTYLLLEKRKIWGKKKVVQRSTWAAQNWIRRNDYQPQ